MNLRHEMLIANAGSGKTFRLTVRTITLLAHGVEPGKIAALTFTRKAAGEFLAAVFLRLAAAASDPASLLALQNDTHISTLDTARCRDLLVVLTTQMHRLCMGTIDSLFGRIARSFPLETGLAGDFAVLGDTARKAAMRDTMAALFREQGEEENRFQDFLDLVRQQSRKRSEREVFDTLLTSISGLHEKYLATPLATIWGNHEMIWPEGNPILQAGDLPSAADNLWEAIRSTHPELDQTAIDAWQIFLQAAREIVADQNWVKEITDFIRKTPSTDKDTGLEYLPTGRTKAARVYLNQIVSQRREALILALLKPRIEAQMRRSRALHQLLAAFEAHYRRRVRNLGQLTFGDITSVLASQVERPEWRASVGYRLDSRFDHWLLDEFQDTSRVQWKVLGGLVDDIIQDTDGGRSFFYVGDTKQAIYSWRGGDPRLFFEIGHFYNQSGTERISRAEPLDVSYRSDPQVIDVINRVFGNIADVAEPLGLPKKVVTEWTQAWVKHEVAPINAANIGYVRWQPVDKDLDDDEAGSAIDREICQILLDVRPWERNWSCAVLKRNNRSVETLAALLQSCGIPVAVEGNSNPCTDNPLGIVLLAAFRFVSSPGDTLSRTFLLTSPYSSAFLGEDEFIFRDDALRSIASEGFAATAQFWLHKMDLTEEPFLTLRARDFVAAAAEFDAARQLGDDLGAFIRHIENYQRQEPEGSGVVRVMTIHQAKGLTLDMTILSGLEDPFAEDNLTGTLTLARNIRNDIWGLLMPGSDISKVDSILHEARMDLLSTSAYGELCGAYVAMTRPRHALYLLTKKIKENSTSKNLARLLALTLGYTESRFETGNLEWYLAQPLSSTSTPFDESIFQWLPSPLRGTPQAISPSLASSKIGRISHSSSNTARIGSEVHSALAEIEWLDLFPPDFAARSETTQEILTRFLTRRDSSSIFTEPLTPHRLWRERAFECLVDGKWVAGVFDRVLIFLDENDAPISAELVDFKTEKMDSATLQTRHAGQLAIYQRAAALLLGLDISQVKARIVGVG